MENCCSAVSLRSPTPLAVTTVENLRVSIRLPELILFTICFSEAMCIRLPSVTAFQFDALVFQRGECCCCKRKWIEETNERRVQFYNAVNKLVVRFCC